MRIATTFWVFISLVILAPKVTESQPDTSHEEDQELDQTKGVSSSTGKRISSWKKLPNLAEKVLKDHNALDIPPKESPELKDEHHTPVSPENLETTSKVRRVTFGVVGEQHHYESSLICRICEVEIPTVPGCDPIQSSTPSIHALRLTQLIGSDSPTWNNTLEYDRKVDALVVEIFGRRIRFHA
ncbi:hypothetical protein L2E82_22621 [Cichorium intybus]|uniref:Uncharacterized protein n=1 Tax=Cichorium intybus TaxID=13427 RepID=A0ACB9DYX6_CICIN|nr:hypothetical protein L2E82_22621 [Cichorium intybus]